MGDDREVADLALVHGAPAAMVLVKRFFLAFGKSAPRPSLPSTS
jgi:hypothetical protein